MGESSIETLEGWGSSSQPHSFTRRDVELSIHYIAKDFGHMGIEASKSKSMYDRFELPISSKPEGSRRHASLLHPWARGHSPCLPPIKQSLAVSCRAIHVDNSVWGKRNQTFLEVAKPITCRPLGFRRLCTVTLPQTMKEAPRGVRNIVSRILTKANNFESTNGTH
jgi:hypothetical protein